MIARGVTLDQLQTAAQEVGVRLVTNKRYPNQGAAVRETKRGPEYRFNLATDSERFGIARDGKGGAPFRRLSDRPPYRALPGRCCWHGHARFLATLFTLAPDAYVRTAMATYRGSLDFWRSYQGTFDKQAPYMGFHLTAPADQVCTCKRSDWLQEPLTVHVCSGCGWRKYNDGTDCPECGTRMPYDRGGVDAQANPR